MSKSSVDPAKLRFILILSAALAAGTGLWLGARMHTPAVDPTPTESPQRLQNALLFPQPRAIPEFALDAANGARFDADALRAHWSLVFIGFTHCPDICPTTLATLGALQKVVNDLVPPLQIVFVSVDPERDSAERAGEYAGYFASDAVGVTADHTRLESFTRSLGMIYAVGEQDAEGYSVDHSARIAILDPEGRQVGLFAPPFEITQMAADLRQLAAR